MTDTLRIDLHLHTKGSWDSLSDPQRILEHARGRGVERIAITDHNVLSVAKAMYEAYPDRVIPGEEVKTAEGVDVIGLYLSEEIPKGTPAEETCRRIHDQGGIVYLPHPYARGKGGSGKLAETLVPHLDVVEVFNARLLSAERNGRAAELARRHGILEGAGSDAHTVGEVGNAYVQLPLHDNRPGEFLRAMAESSTHGRPASPLVFAKSNLAKIRKRFGRSD